MTADFNEIMTYIKKLVDGGSVKTVAIDGRCASGKTTLAAALLREIKSDVVHTDDFFLPFEMRTVERLSTPGGNIHYERLYDEVISKLGKYDKIKYGVFDCSSGEIEEYTEIDCRRTVIVEGSYSMHPYFGKYYDLSVFVTADYEERLRRIELRNGVQKLEVFKTKWIPLEERYFSEYSIERTADITVNI